MKTTLQLMLVITGILLLPLTNGLTSDFRQCANGDGQCDWIGSVLNTNSIYQEGMSVPQELLLTDLPAAPSDTYTITFSHAYTKGGIQAYDFLTGFNQGNNEPYQPSFNLDLCGDFNSATKTTACQNLRSSTHVATADLPDDTYESVNGLTQEKITAYEATYGNREITMYGNQEITITDITLTHTEPPLADGADSRVDVAITWQSTSTNVLIEFGGHLAVGNNDPVGWGIGGGAASVSGASYHINIDDNTLNLGSDNNQIQTSAVQPIGGEPPEDPPGEDPEDPTGEDPEDPTGEDPEDPEDPTEDTPSELTCELDIALIMDRSSSINAQELALMKIGMQTVADAFLPGSSSEIALITFDADGAVEQEYTSDSDTISTAIQDVTSGFGTNWEDGLIQARSLFENRENVADVFILASDGRPTRSVSGGGNHLGNALVVADQIKQLGVRLVAVGVYDPNDPNSIAALQPENLEAIASPDSTFIADFETLAQELQALTETLCYGTITVEKYVEDGFENNWDFTVTDESGNEQTITSGETIEYSTATNDKTLQVQEILQSGYEVQSAACVRAEEERGVHDGNGLITDITLRSQDNVVCTFNNGVSAFCGDNSVNQGSEECDGSAPEGYVCVDCQQIAELSCINEGITYPIDEGEQLQVALVDIFNGFEGFDYNYDVDSPQASVTATFDSASQQVEIEVAPSASGGTVTVTASIPGDSYQQSCELNVEQLSGTCSSSTCQSCITSDEAQTVQCLQTNGCMENPAVVYGGITAYPVYELIQSVALEATDQVTGIQTPFAGYSITTAPVTPFSPVGIQAEISANPESLLTLQIQKQGYATEMNFCIPLQTVTGLRAPEAEQPISDFIVTASRSIIHYISNGGLVTAAGPFIFTAQVWIR